VLVRQENSRGRYSDLKVNKPALAGRESASGAKTRFNANEKASPVPRSSKERTVRPRRDEKPLPRVTPEDGKKPQHSPDGGRKKKRNAT